jgi:hypothetical protein
MPKEIWPLPHNFVRVLEAVNTEKSRLLLRRMAMGEIEMMENSILNAWAVRALIACDENEARTLLSSSNSNVLVNAINGLRGQLFDEKLMRSLEQCLKNEDTDVQQRVIDIMASEAPSGELANRALEHIRTALAAVADIPNLDEPSKSSHEVTFAMTVGEENYRPFNGSVDGPPR